MRRVPILDTNVFLDAANGKISVSDWKILRRSLPKSGCPLSAITLGELLLGLARCTPEMFSQAQESLLLARSVSKGRVLAQPESFAWENVFHMPRPNPGIDARKLHEWLELACRAKTRAALIETKLRDKRALRRGGRYVGLDLFGIERDIVAAQTGYIRAARRTLQWLASHESDDRTAPRARSAQRLVEKLKYTYDQENWKRRTAESFLEGSGLEPTDERLDALATRLDAAFTLGTTLARQTFLGTYRFDKNPSDWFDYLQLHYLAKRDYCFVTRDKRLIHRIAECAQSQSVFTFDSFIGSL